MFELVIIWDTGEKDVYTYNTEIEAETSGKNFKMAFGNQISWFGVRKGKNENSIYRKRC